VGLSSGSSTVRWTADGRGVAYVNARAGSNIWIQPLDGSEARPLTHFNDGKRIVSFTWSPDFARLAIVRERTSTDIVLFKGLKPSTGRN
jgi:Tol biopolymer transport system component